MIDRILGELGPWNWMVLGFMLLAAEIVLPGVFLLWIGVAALLTGFVSLQLWGTDFWTWHVQLLLFILLCPLAVLVGRRLLGKEGPASDQPLLNRAAEQMVGRTATLAEPIREGRGRIRLGDTLWRVAGPDLPAGARVRVTGVEDTQLTVAEAGPAQV